MAYDRDSFLAGVAVGRNMLGWPGMEIYDQSVFSFTIIVTASSLSYSFAMYSFAGTIYWGDGSEEEAETHGPYAMGVSHTYTSPGIYRVRVSGNVYRPIFYGSGASMLLSVNTPFPPPTMADGTPVDSAILSDTFYDCVNLIYIPSDLLQNYRGIEIANISRMFRNCRRLSTIPERLFDGLETDPDISVAAYELFRDCVSIVEFPKDIFSSPMFESLGSVERMFRGCTSLLKIPDKLPFKKSMTFSGLCEYCSSLQEIPSGFFDDCTKMTNADSLFINCHSITEIPSGLFDNCPDITTAINTFLYTSVTSIPSGLFAGKSRLTSVAGMFRDTKILDVPGNLFDGCTSLTSAEQTFYLCRDLVTVGQGLFSQSPNMDYFINCFRDCGSITSNVPELWEMFPNAQYHSRCFRGCVNAANYADIPSGWK